MKEVNSIINSIKKGEIKPIYFLCGDEPYYIDQISDYIEANGLSEEEKGFNQMTLYARDTSVEQIVSYAKRFPMMSEKMVIIIKEAQDLSRNIEKLLAYAENPLDSTVLVFCYKYKKLDKRKKISKVLAKNGVVFEGKKLYDNQVPDWISKYLANHKYKITPKATMMLAEFLGTDLSKIKNELSKLTSIIASETEITEKHIEENIGFSKDFNNFELRKAIGTRDVLKSNKIIQHFSHNPKEHPLVMSISILANFFIQILLCHGLTDKSPNNIAKNTGVHPFFVGEYTTAIKNYPMRKVSQIIYYLKIADLKSKGVGATATGTPHKEILKELIFKILH